MIILAGISINILIGENGIIGKAKEASIATDVAETKEKIQLELMGKHGEEGSYTNEDVISIVKQITGNDIEKGAETTTTKKGNTVNISDLWIIDSWSQDKTKVTNGIITFEVGDAVSGYTGNNLGDGKWYVLGAEDGKLLITTNTNLVEEELFGREGYKNGINIVNNATAPYSDDNMADSVRAINVEDINRVTGYDPDVAQYNSGTNKTNQWGNEVTYTLNEDDSKIHYQGTKYPTTDTISGASSFTYWNGSNWITLGSGESATIVNDYYTYNLQTLSSTPSSESQVNGSEKAYNLLFTRSYSLNSRWVATEKGACNYGFHGVVTGGIVVTHGDICNSIDRESQRNIITRPVVSLKSNVKVTSDGKLSI